MSEETIVLDLEIIRQTEKAILAFDGDTQVWLPKSKCTVLCQLPMSDLFEIECPEWIAEDKGLI